MIVLHHGWRSSASRRVRLCLEEKGLAYEAHNVDMTNMEHHSPEYLKINPLGVIPTMLHDGKPLHESGTICEYLDETFPDPPLRPDTPYQRAEMRNWIRHIDGLIGNLIIFNWRHHLQKTASQWTDEELAEKLKKIPSKERQEAWLRVARKPYTEGRARGGPAKAHHAIARPDGGRAETVRLDGRPSLFDRRHRGDAVRQADRRGDRARRNDREKTSPRRRLVD
jgi:glutathione S-transferase